MKIENYNDKREQLMKLLRNDIPAQFNENTFLMKHGKRVEQILKGNTIPPYEIIIQPSCLCNLKCLWCVGNNIDNYSNSNMVQRLSDPEAMVKMLKGIIDYKKEVNVNGIIEEFKVERIQFSGLTGEPLVHKKALLAGIKYLNSVNQFTGLFTNGVLMDESTWEVLSNINYVLISLDAGKHETYSFTKCASSDVKVFDKVVNNIRSLINKRNQLNGKVDVNIGFVLNPYNFDEIHVVAKLMKEAGVHYLRIKTDIANKLNLTNDQRLIAEESLKQAKILEDDYFKVVEIHKIYDNEAKKRKFTKCYMNTVMSAIAADGKVYPCNYYTKADRSNYGSAIDEPFGEIFENRVDLDIPKTCPSACDPYKNRSNALIQQLDNINTELDNNFNLVEFWKTFKTEIKESYKKNVHESSQRR